MKKTLAIILLLTASCAAQLGTTTKIRTGGTLPTVCSGGDVFLKSGTSAGIYYNIAAGTCSWSAVSGGGTTVSVNGSSVSTPNFNGTTPSAGAGNVNVTWQVSSSSVSAEVPSIITVNGTTCTLGSSCSITAGTSGFSSINAQSGTTYTLVLGDAGAYVRASNAASITITVPPNSSVAFPTGTVVTFIQVGAGQVTLAPGSGVTLNTPTSLSARAQWSTITITKVGTNEWDTAGDLQ